MLLGSLILVLTLAAPGDVLVLKNGKKLPCDSYEVSGDKVMVLRGKERFALPLAQVDLARSEAATAAQAAEEVKAREAAEAARLKKEAAEQTTIERMADHYAEQDTKKRNRNVSITTDQLKARGHYTPPRPTSRATVQAYRTVGNNILVRVMLNDRGPYTFILDTGAAMSLISRSMARELGLTEGQAVSVHGVGGRARSATARVASIALGEARVDNLAVVIQDIPILQSREVDGLLGQDFLNHFVMNLDGAEKTLSLTPHGRDVADPNPGNSSIRSSLPDELKILIQEARALTEEVLQSGSAAVDKARIAQLQRQCKELTTELKDHQSEHPCFPLIVAVLERLTGHLYVLRKPFDGVDKERYRRLARSWNGVGNKIRDVEGCGESR